MSFLESYLAFKNPSWHWVHGVYEQLAAELLCYVCLLNISALQGNTSLQALFQTWHAPLLALVAPLSGQLRDLVKRNQCFTYDQ
jgi:hypothetical protein